jgi:tyrosyl-tRNA synthetase
LFTDFPKEKIVELEIEVKNSPENRVAQLALADEMTTLIHGEKGVLDAKGAQKALFSNNEKLGLNEILAIAATIPNKSTTLKDLEGKNIQDLMVLLGASASKGAGKKLIDSGGVSVNGEKVTNPFLTLTESLFIANKALLLKVGKKSHFVLTLKE